MKIQRQIQPNRECIYCKKTLSISFFSKNSFQRKDGSHGYRTYCKSCAVQHEVKRKQSTSKPSNEVQRKWAKNYRDRNPGWDTLRVSMRRKAVKIATPSYYTNEDFKTIYEKAKQLGMHVDHIIPLVHPLVCGLHVPANLQLLSPRENIIKNNQYTP